MPTMHQVDPQSFIHTATSEPAHGRGAWVREGIDFNYRYALADDPEQRIGVRAQESLAHWAVAAGSYAIQLRLVDLGYMDPIGDGERGIFGPRTDDAVRAFQESNVDPDGDEHLAVDGIVGKADCRALFTPLIRAAQRRNDIPRDLLLGETNHESQLDPGAVGYYIYYPDYRGVDRGMSQINSKFNSATTWLEAYDPAFALEWSADRLRGYFEKFRRDYPDAAVLTCWDAAVCAHNSPVNAAAWMRNGAPPNETAAKYVAAVKAARY